MSSYVKLTIGAVIMAGTVGYVAYLGAAASWQYYVLVDECTTSASELRGKRLRVSGRVAAESLKIHPDRTSADFVLQGSQHRLPVRCVCALPDNLEEEMEVVVEGCLRGDGLLEAETVITRCASKYEPEDA